MPDRHARIDFKCQKFPKFGFDSKPICMRKEWSRTQILKKWRPSKSGCKSILKFNGLKIVQQKTLYKRYFWLYLTLDTSVSKRYHDLFVHVDGNPDTSYHPRAFWSHLTKPTFSHFTFHNSRIFISSQTQILSRTHFKFTHSYTFYKWFTSRVPFFACIRELFCCNWIIFVENEEQMTLIK